PEELKDGSVKVEQIGRIKYSGIAIDDQGEIYTWGAKSDKIDQIPEIDGKIIKIESGREHITALTDSGKIYSWGVDNYGSTEAQEDENFVNVFNGYFNNYGIKEDGSID